MTITLELAPEMEANLLAQAKAHGLSLDAFVKSIVTDQAVANGLKTPIEGQGQHSQGEEFDRAIDDLFDAADLPPGIGEGALSRENWYR
jgi:hypothetical protein